MPSGNGGNMLHNFDTDIAKQYGMLEAILLNNIYYWIEKNRANETNFYDGAYWTFNSTKAFNQLFPYVSERQIKNALKHLRDEEILITGNYNKSTYDRTLWYALSKKGLSIVQKCPMEGTQEDNGKCNNVPPIPNNKPDINTHSKPDDHSCPDVTESKQEQPEETIVITLQLNTGDEYPITESHICLWAELYPSVDIRQELRNMKGWLLSNPKKRKTKNGILRFVTNWLTREQNSGRNRGQSQTESSDPLRDMIERGFFDEYERNG